MRASLPVFAACLVALGASPAVAAETLQVVEATPAAEFDAQFFRNKGWVGADGNYSVQVSPERRLWLYSDTWIGEVAGGRRQNCTMINNSVGVQTVHDGQAKVDFYWGADSGGKPTALIRPSDGQGWFWLFGGAFADGRLQLLLWQMEKAAGSAAFGFRNVAVWHGEVLNPHDEPTSWRVEQHKLPFTQLSDDRRLLFGSAVMQHEGMTYIYGVDERPRDKFFGRRMVLARVATADFARFDRWQFRTADAWSHDFQRAEPLAAGMATEYSVMRLPGSEQFVAVTSDVFLSPKIVARVAPDPWGPWSNPTTLYTCSEPAGSKSIFCYAGKSHATLSSPGELVLSYAANTTNFGEIFSQPSLYWPRFVRVKLK